VIICTGGWDLPTISRFAKGIKLPVTDFEKSFIAWQEDARKDIERAFGVLQACFQVMSRPFHGHLLKKIGKIVSACLIMLKMCISDRVMGDNVYTVYNPCYNVDDDNEEQYILEEDRICIEGNNNHDNDKFGHQAYMAVSELVLQTPTMNLLDSICLLVKLIGVDLMTGMNMHVCTVHFFNLKDKALLSFYTCGGNYKEKLYLSQSYYGS
jgi:hypothetical protein